MSERAQEVLAIVFAMIAFLFASSMDYEDAVSDMDVTVNKSVAIYGLTTNPKLIAKRSNRYE